MALIAPFRGIRYNQEKIGRLEDVVTPPYDVIDEKAQAAFIAANPYNMIRLDICKRQGKESGGSGRYEKSRDLFQGWRDDGILIRDEAPSIYLYHIDYDHPSGKRLTRKGLVSLVGLSDFSEGIVKPHEKTFMDVTDDRLELLDTCHAHFSQIFSLYPDSNGEIMECLEKACPDEPLISILDQYGSRHRIWQVSDLETLNSVQSLFQDRSLYIADGHHRYTTALQMQNRMRDRLGELPLDSPYNFVMMYLCPMEDQGLSVLPTHRLVRLIPGTKSEDTSMELSIDKLARDLDGAFQVKEIKGASGPDLLTAALAEMDKGRGDMESGTAGPAMFGLYHTLEDRCLVLTLKNGVMEKTFGESIPSVLQALDVVVLSDLLFERILGLDHERCEKENLISYFADQAEAFKASHDESSGNGKVPHLLFLMNHTPVSQVKEVADQGLTMPHKSTFFYPKILTGLLINGIDPDEGVKLP